MWHTEVVGMGGWRALGPGYLSPKALWSTVPVGEPRTQAEVEEERKLVRNMMVNLGEKKDGVAMGRRANGGTKVAETEFKKSSMIWWRVCPWLASHPWKLWNCNNNHFSFILINFSLYQGKECGLPPRGRTYIIIFPLHPILTPTGPSILIWVLMKWL